MLREHIKYWWTWPKEIAEQVLVILVDDGSPRNPAKDVLAEFDLPVKVQLYRIKENIPWNYTGSKNLGFHVAPEGWVFSIDMDHVVTAESMESLFNTTLDPKCYYRPARYAVFNGKRIRPHGISFIITRELFWRAGGYDESYAGQRSKAAGVITKALRGVGKCVDLEKSVYLTYFIPSIVDDCRTRDWSREPAPKLKRGGSRKDRLRFNWERVI